MSRCKACDAVLTDAELAMTNEHTGQPEDLCYPCLGHALDAVLEQEEGTDGLTEEELDTMLSDYDYSSEDYE